MELHENQQLAVDAMREAVKSGLKLLVKGPAGTGKSTVTKEGLSVIKRAADGRAIYSTSFTNKAVQRMIEIGFPKETAMTCHRLIYRTQVYIQTDLVVCESETAVAALKLIKKDKKEKAIDLLDKNIIVDEKILEQNFSGEINKATQYFLRCVDTGQYKKESENKLIDEWNKRDIIIVDEVGMLDYEMLLEIMRRYDTVIMMGDHRQLPPISGQDTINVVEPDVTVELTHVFRTGDNSHILDLATAAEKDSLGDCGVLTVEKFTELAKKDYQFICHTNNDVYRITTLYRAVKGIEGRPLPNEKIISYSRINAFNKERSDSKEAQKLYASYIADMETPPFEIERIPGEADIVWKVTKRKFMKNTIFEATGEAFKHEGNCYVGVKDPYNADKVWYIETVPFWALPAREWNTCRTSGVLNLYFSHCITCHRAQGSEMSNVAVMARDRQSESYGPRAQQNNFDRPRFNYTAVTRAKKDVVVFRDLAYR